MQEVMIIQRAMHDKRLDEGDWTLIAVALDAGGVLQIHEDVDDIDDEFIASISLDPRGIIERLVKHNYILTTDIENGIICEVIR
jgi:hypothetical protein